MVTLAGRSAQDEVLFRPGRGQMSSKVAYTFELNLKLGFRRIGRKVLIPAELPPVQNAKTKTWPLYHSRMQHIIDHNKFIGAGRGT